MAIIYYDHDADPKLLAGRTVAIIGYGNQGRAQALNLRDSGVRVVVGGLPDATLDQAAQDGFPIMPTREAARQGDIICLLIPDEVQPRVYQEDLRPELREGKALDFAHGYNIHYGFIAPPPEVDVIMVAPRMIGVGVRDRYLAARGVPAFVAVQQDGSGQAWAKTLALARALGCTRAGAIRSTFAEETELDHFSEQFVWPAVYRALLGSFEFLTSQGYQPEAVVMELWGSKEAAEIMQRAAEVGLLGQLDLHSQTSQYGTLTHLETALPEGIEDRMEAVLDRIRAGLFAREWEQERGAGYPVFTRLKAGALSHPVNGIEQAIRKLLE